MIREDPATRCPFFSQPKMNSQFHQMENSFTMNKPVSRQSNIVVQDLENEVLIYDLTINKAFCLNQTSGLVFALCDGTRTVTQISNLMSVNLKTLVSEDFVYLALAELKKNNLLENSDEFPDHFAGLSRREVVKKVGLASMVALPVIASVVAPNAAMSQSGGCNLNTCVTGVCIPAGQDVCAGCSGCQLIFNNYPVGTDCTAPIATPTQFVNCLASYSVAFDAQIGIVNPIP